MRNVISGLSSKRLFVGAVLTAGAVALSVGAIALATSGGHARNRETRFHSLATEGDRIALSRLSKSELARLAHAGANTRTASLMEVGTRSNAAFYTIPTSTGGVCYGAGIAADQPDIGILACPEPGTTFPFPSQSMPIFDLSLFAVEPASGATQVGILQGFAADGVASVGVLGVDGSVTTTGVENNVYALPHPTDVSATAIAAFDASGTIIYEKPLSPN